MPKLMGGLRSGEVVIAPGIQKQAFGVFRS